MVHNAGRWCASRSVVYNIVLYCWGSAQRRSHKPGRTDKQTLPNILSPCRLHKICTRGWFQWQAWRAGIETPPTTLIILKRSQSLDTLFSKRNLSFPKLHFFWRRLYAKYYQEKSSRPYVKVSDPGAPGKMDRLNLSFFRRRVYLSTIDYKHKTDNSNLLTIMRILSFHEKPSTTQ